MPNATVWVFIMSFPKTVSFFHRDTLRLLVLISTVSHIIVYICLFHENICVSFWMFFCIYSKFLESMWESCVIVCPTWPKDSVAAGKAGSVTRERNCCSWWSQNVSLEFTLLPVFSLHRSSEKGNALAASFRVCLTEADASQLPHF